MTLEHLTDCIVFFLYYHCVFFSAEHLSGECGAPPTTAVVGRPRANVAAETQPDHGHAQTQQYCTLEF